MSDIREPDRSLHIVPFSQLTERSVGWLWRGRIPLGKLTILDGDPGMGKSVLTLDICARATTGRPFPGDVPAIGPVNVLVLNAEDDNEDTVKPRLRVMGADLDRVFGPHEEGAGLTEPWRFPADTAQLEKTLQRTQARLVVIDPIVAFLERSILSSNDQSVRRALLPLAVLARRYQCAILLVRHLNKRASLRAAYRGGGSIGFLGACRAAWLVAPDPHDGGQRVLAPVKNNLAPPQPSLGFRIEGQEANALTIAWTGTSACTADELLAVTKPGGSLLERETARDVLEDFLRAAPRTRDEVWQFAAQQGIAERTLFRAKGELRVEARRLRLGGKRLCYWLLPEQELPEEVRQASWQEGMQEFHRRVMEMGKEPAKKGA
jgi:AAA domain